MNKFQKLIARFLIPKGYYCYARINAKRSYCPFYFTDKTRHQQENGYCSYLEKGDWDINNEYPEYIECQKRQQDGTYKKEMIHKSELLPMSLLFDACKECGINYWGKI
jgi:hypothetical protein